jgi:hypothetical protein
MIKMNGLSSFFTVLQIHSMLFHLNLELVEIEFQGLVLLLKSVKICFLLSKTLFNTQNTLK